MAGSQRLPAMVPRQRRVSFCPTAPFSASSPRRPRRSVRAATAAGSLPTGFGIAAYAMAGTDLRRILRSAARPDEIARRIADLVRSVWRGRTDRGAEQRKANQTRTAFVPLDTLLSDPHFEMHTRGG
jgi:hypothetical protein